MSQAPVYRSVIFWSSHKIDGSMRLAPVLAVAAVATAAPPRGFLLVATRLPVQLLQRDADTGWRRDELGCVLRDICAQEKYPATVVVGDANEVSTVERNRPCDRVVARLLPDRRRLGARGGRAATPAPTYCGTTTARSAMSTSRRGRRRAATTRRRTNWSCGTTSTTATLPRLLRRRRRGNFLSITSSRKALLAAVRH